MWNIFRRGERPEYIHITTLPTHSAYNNHFNITKHPGRYNVVTFGTEEDNLLSLFRNNGFLLENGSI